MKRNYRVGSAAITLILTMIFVAPSRAQLDSPVPYKSITPQVESTIEKTAIIALRRISQARSDIHRKAWASARRELAEAARLMESIRDDLSTSTAKSLIRVARKHLELEHPQQVQHDLPPIYSSLDLISVYLPTDKAKMHIDRAKGYLGRNDKRGADRELILADRSLIVIEVELPLLNAQRYVTKAQKYLNANDARKADEALQVAEQRAMALYTGVNSPLYQAKKNIWLAFWNYSTARKSDARAYLEQARENLGKAAAGGSATEKEEAAKLLNEVTELEKKLAGEGKVAESALKTAWEKSEALAERSMAYLSAGLSEVETTLKGENNLIEAKLHVAYAETYQVTTEEPDKVVKELDMAESYLKKATQDMLVDKTSRKKISEIQKALLVLKANPNKSDVVVKERYEYIKNELSNLIQEL
jgi:hypothetical protein